MFVCFEFALCFLSFFYVLTLLASSRCCCVYVMSSSKTVLECSYLAFHFLNLFLQITVQKKRKKLKENFLSFYPCQAKLEMLLSTLPWIPTLLFIHSSVKYQPEPLVYSEQEQRKYKALRMTESLIKCWLIQNKELVSAF